MSIMFDIFMGEKKTICTVAALASAIAGMIYILQESDHNLRRYMTEPIVDTFEPDSYNSDYNYGIYNPFIDQYAGVIVAAARMYGVPPEYIAGTIVSENHFRNKREDIKDAIGLLWDNSALARFGTLDPSLGVGQVKVSTAQFLDDTFNRGHLSYHETELALEDPERNIYYMAMMLSSLMHRPNRELIGNMSVFDPHYAAIIGSEYVMGPTSSLLEDAEPSGEGYSFALELANTPTIRLFGECATIQRAQQSAMRTYAWQNINRLRKEHTLWR